MDCRDGQRESVPQSILLPENDSVFRNLSKAKRFAIDIG